MHALFTLLPCCTLHICLWGHYVGSRHSSSLYDAVSPVSVSKLLKKHETEFFEVVNPKLKLLKLKRIGVITEVVLSHINTATNEDAKEILYDHLIRHANLDTLRKYCDVASEVEGHPKMQSFGKMMKEELQ